MDKKPTTVAPQLSPVTFNNLDDGDSGQLEHGADLEGLQFDDVTLDVLDLGAATVLGSRFADLSADEADLKGVRLIESAFDHLNVPVVHGARGAWRDVQVEAARIGSAELYEATWHSVHFINCKLSFVNLRGAELRDVAFTNCTIEELDLVQATTLRVALNGTKIGRLDVQHAELQHFDLRGAEFDELDGIQSLAGATITPDQLTLLAGHLAKGLGLKVEAPAR